MAERHPKTLYHYCSIETFFNVIKSNSVWLSDIEKSNDSLELTYMKNEYLKPIPSPTKIKGTPVGALLLSCKIRNGIA